MRTKYELSEELALQHHYQPPGGENAEKWKEYCDFADAASAKARKWLGIKKLIFHSIYMIVRHHGPWWLCCRIFVAAYYRLPLC